MSERKIKVTLLDGSIVTMNTEERVISYQLAEQMIPLTTDADSVFDDVLAALEEAQQQLHRTQITSSVNEGNSDSYFSECERLRGLMAEAQQTIAQLTKALSFYGNRMCIQAEDIGWNVGFIAREALRKIGEGETQP